jgi:hypothetical protein
MGDITGEKRTGPSIVKATVEKQVAGFILDRVYGEVVYLGGPFRAHL